MFLITLFRFIRSFTNLSAEISNKSLHVNLDLFLDILGVTLTFSWIAENFIVIWCWLTLTLTLIFTYL